jgi:HTH-type transcriptional regulator, competence development regulator
VIVEKRYKIEIAAFGKRLRQLRKKKGISQLDLEIQSGINRTEISRIENGLKNIEFMTMVRLAEALGEELYDLFSKR